MQEAAGKLGYLVIFIAEQRVTSTLEFCDLSHSKVFIKNVLVSCLTRLLISILGDLSSTKECFECAIVCVAKAPKSFSIIALTIVKDDAAKAPIFLFAAKIMEM